MTDPLDALVGRVREKSKAVRVTEFNRRCEEGCSVEVACEFADETERAVWERCVRELGERLLPFARQTCKKYWDYGSVSAELKPSPRCKSEPCIVCRAAALLSPQKEGK